MSLSASNENEDVAALRFAQGVESCNPEMIRDAVTRGASVDQLPGRNVSPLQLALNKCLSFTPRAEECVATLVELGYPIDDRPDKTPTVLDCTATYRQEEDALRLLKIVTPLGANVNVQSPSGDTALLGAVAHDWRTVVLFLRDHGADPTIKDSRGVSPIDWLAGKDCGFGANVQRMLQTSTHA